MKLSKDDLPSVLKVLGDEKRLEILVALRQKELCACQLIKVVDLEGPALSKQLASLIRVGVVSRRQQGKWAFFKFDPQLGDLGHLQLVEQICQKFELSIDLDRLRRRVNDAVEHIKCE